MGRKRTSPDERRSVAVTILLKPAEAQTLREAARYAKYSLSSYCRGILFPSAGPYRYPYPEDMQGGDA